MKKYIMFLAIMLSFSVASLAFAGAATNTTAGADLVQTGDSATCPGGELRYSPSPSTLMATNTTATDYALQGASAKTTTDNGMEYGVLSNDEGYFQRTQNTANEVTAPQTATSLHGSADTWADKNGSTPLYR